MVLTYKHGDFLRQCIDSILAQDYPNIEIVVGDDASDDGTAELLAAYHAAHPGKFVILASTVNRGPSKNANEILKHLSGDYVAYIDGDDLMLPGKLERQVAFMEANPGCTICYHDVEVFDSDSGKTLRYFNSGRGSIPARQGPAARLLLRHGTFMCSCSAMYRRTAMPPDGYDDRLRRSPDWLYWIEVGTHGGDIRFVPGVWGRYRRHENNITNFNRNSVDPFLALALAEAKHPQFARDARLGRGRLWYARALEAFQAGDAPAARRLLSNALDAGLLNWKVFARFLVGYGRR